MVRVKKIAFSFAKTSTVGFGSLAASQQQQSSVFGGSGFGALAQQPQKSSIFGGGLNSSITNRFSILYYDDYIFYCIQDWALSGIFAKHSSTLITSLAVPFVAGERSVF